MLLLILNIRKVISRSRHVVGYLKLALCHYDIKLLCILFFGKKYKFLHPFFRKLFIHVFDIYSFPQYVILKLSM